MVENRARKVCRGLCCAQMVVHLDLIEIDFKEWDEVLIMCVM